MAYLIIFALFIILFILYRVFISGSGGGRSFLQYYEDHKKSAEKVQNFGGPKEILNEWIEYFEGYDFYIDKLYDNGLKIKKLSDRGKICIIMVLSMVGKPKVDVTVQVTPSEYIGDEDPFFEIDPSVSKLRISTEMDAETLKHRIINETIKSSSIKTDQSGKSISILVRQVFNEEKGAKESGTSTGEVDPTSRGKNPPLTDSLEATDESLVDFCTRNPQFFKNIISLRYPLKEAHIERYGRQLQWGPGGLTSNESLPWSKALIDRYRDRWNWESRAGLGANGGLPWTEDLIAKYTERWNWKSLSGNEELPWNEDLIARYLERWNWGVAGISANEGLPWCRRLIDRFSHRWYWMGLSLNVALPWSEQLLSRFEKKFYWGKHGLSQNYALPWTEELFERHIDRWYWKGLSFNPGLPWDEKFIERYHGRWTWGEGGLSWNSGLPWSNEFIAHHVDQWHWRGYGLSDNAGLPWTDELIERYSERWAWRANGGLSQNSALPWTEQLIAKYQDRWDWDALSGNPALPWSEKLIDKYGSHWHWPSLRRNTGVWKQVFEQRASDALIDKMFS